MENDFYLVKVNEDGTLDILDKDSGSEFRGCLRFVDEGDRGDSYNFDAVPDGEILDRPVGPPVVEVVEEGPVKGALKLTVRYRIPEKLKSERARRSSEHIETTITTINMASFVSLSFFILYENCSSSSWFMMIHTLPILL